MIVVDNAAYNLPKIVGRYAIYEPPIASGGMATVHIGRLVARGGFSRTVAIKRMHPHVSSDPEFVSMFMDEARLAGHIRHPNVIGTIDVVASQKELFLVMDYVHGESLAKLLAGGEEIPLPVASAVLVNALDGLHAAHEATNDQGEPLHIVHRDVSPQNVLVGVDGIARVIDFGVAKAADGSHSTQAGQIKGKIAYMAPEQMLGWDMDRRTDVYAASVVLWQVLTGQKLFRGTEAEVIGKVASATIQPPSAVARPGRVSLELDRFVMRGLSRRKEDRWESAREMARALERHIPVAPPSEVAAWVRAAAGATIDERSRRVAQIEQSTPSDLMRPNVTSSPPPPIPSEVAVEVDAEPPSPEPRKWLPLVGFAAIGLTALSAVAAVIVWNSKPAAVPPLPAEVVTVGSASPAEVSVPVSSAPIAPAVEPSAAPTVSPATPTLPPARRAPARPASSAAKKRDDVDNLFDSRN
jgi:serine/threonine-protein kinase